MPWTIGNAEHKKMVESCVEGFPLESCGLFLGPTDSKGIPTGEISLVWPANNIEKSARIYSIDPKDMFEATKFADEKNWEIVGVYHSHTHTKGYPSPTDIEQAVDPNWCYAIVSLEQEEIVSNYFQIDKSNVVNLEIDLVVA